MICSWLGLKPEEWPPNHYRLLGLAPGESDAALIEQSVHRRLDCVRCYQMLHPEQATEAMNRLAQAFVCLSEPGAKRAYDAVLLGTSASAEPPAVVASVESLESLEVEYQIESRTPGVLLAEAPPPAESVKPPPLPTTGDTDELDAGPTAIVAPAPALPAALSLPTPPPLPPLPDLIDAAPPKKPEPAPPPAEPVDPVVEAAESPRARRGLATKRGLYYRIARTRRLLRAWEQIGHYLKTPRERSLRRAEVRDLLARVEAVQELLARFPPLLGEAGQPGYHILNLEQNEPARLRKMPEGERQTLANDWNAGKRLLLAHRDFLRQELQALRKRSLKDRVVLMARAALNDHPTFTLVLVAAVALLISFLRTH